MVVVSKHPNAIFVINPLNSELNPICHLLELLRAHHILHISRIRVKVHAALRKQDVGA
jgi:hypothetical protein